MKRIFTVVLSLFLIFDLSATTKEVRLKLIETSDIHGNFYPYNFIRRQEWGGSLARIYSYVQKQREVYADNLLLFDNGDLLQGQPSVYYYNFMDTVSTHLAASVMNYMGYNAGNMGNHDVEAGHAVFDRWIKQCNFPILGANIEDAVSHKPYLKPYEVFVRDGVKVAVLGMITPAIPVWLPESLWKGLYFADMEETARKWVRFIRETEKPDVIVGVFHAGSEARTMSGKYREDASLEVATNVPGFDVVMMGHDHSRYCQKIVNIEGDSVLLINPASNGRVVGDVDVVLKLVDGKVLGKQFKGQLTDMDQFSPSEDFFCAFSSQYEAVQRFVSEKVGSFTECVTTRPAYVGPSAFIDFIHTLQLELTGADVSFAAPLSFDAKIAKGDLTISDMFSLYKYENMLYTMRLTGKEIKDYLEESYAMWVNQMKSPEDHLLLLMGRKRGERKQWSFVNPSFNFDSAAGIIYTVDVTKPKGERVTILRMANGQPFVRDKSYKVALNSYRGNDGGELLTKGAGIAQSELRDRILSATDKDLRYYMIQYIKQKKVLSPQPLDQWKFVPEKWAVPAGNRDLRLLFE